MTTKPILVRLPEMLVARIDVNAKSENFATRSKYLAKKLEDMTKGELDGEISRLIASLSRNDISPDVLIDTYEEDFEAALEMLLSE